MMVISTHSHSCQPEVFVGHLHSTHCPPVRMGLRQSPHIILLHLLSKQLDSCLSKTKTYSLSQLP